MTSERDAAQTDTPRWREYSAGRPGAAAAAIAATMLALLCGVAASGALVVAVGIAAEEGLLPAPEANRAADSLARVALLVVVVLGWLAGLALTSANGWREVAVSRALVSAAETGASRNEVPHPSQVRETVARGFGSFVWFAGATIGLAGFFLVLAIFAVLESPSEDGFVIVFAGLAVLGLLGGAISWIVKRIRPQQRERRPQITQHWTSADESRAWGRARSEAKASVGDGAAGNDGPATRIADILLNAGGVCAAACIILLQLTLVLTHPDAETWPGGRLGERAELSEQGEALADVGTWGVVGLAIAGIVLLAVGFAVSGTAQARERAALRRAVADPDAERPANDLLQRHGEWHPVRLAQWLAALGGAGLCAGLSVIGLVSGVLGDVVSGTSGSAEHFAGLSAWSVLATVLSALLVVVAFAWHWRSFTSGRELRNALMARWPTPPAAKPS